MQLADLMGQGFAPRQNAPQTFTLADLLRVITRGEQSGWGGRPAVRYPFPDWRVIY